MDFPTLLASFDAPDEVRQFPFGRFEIVRVAGIALGRAVYQPGWKWSQHNAAKAGTTLCHIPHTGIRVARNKTPPGLPAAWCFDGTTVRRFRARFNIL